MLRRDTCIVCKSNTSKLFYIPKDRMRQWLQNVNQEKLLDDFSIDYIRNNGRICADHFEDKYFISTLRDRLNKIAVPFDPLPSSSRSIGISSSSIQALPSTSSNPISLSISSSIQALPSTSSNQISLNTSSSIQALPSTSNPISLSTAQDLSSFSNLVELENKTSTPKALELTPKTKTIRRLRSDISKLKKKLALKDDELNALDYIKSKVTAVQYDFICDQIENSKKDPRGRRWTARAKAMAMHIYLHGKSCYNALRDYFAFPCINTLKNSVGIVAKDVGFCPVLKKALQEKSKKFKSWENICTLVFDEMAIKKGLQLNAQVDYVDGWESAERDGPKQLATQALVFMIRGIVHNWKQVIAYYFRANTSPPFWFEKCVRSILDDVGSCGFKVITTVCDMGPINQALYRDLGVSVSQPFFEHGGSKIFAIYDICHLLKNVRNNLINYDIEFTEIKKGNEQRRRMRASWTDIEQFYKDDIKDDNKYRSAQKLTESHIYPDQANKMRVKLAAQVFSHTVAAGLSMSVRGGLIRSQAAGTAEFAGCMNNLFDSMNSKERFSPKPLASAASLKTNHEQFWRDMCDWVQSWKFINRNDNTESSSKPFQRGLIITLKAVLGVFEYFKNERIPYLLTNRLNQDCLENTFSSVRRRGGFRDNPDCKEFRATIRHVIVHNFTKRVRGSNCERDNAENFITLSNMNGQIAEACFENDHVAAESDITDAEIAEDNESEIVAVNINENREMGTEDDGENSVIQTDEDLEQVIIKTAENDMQDNILAYIAGFLARAYLRKYPCDECQAILVNKDKYLDFHTFLLYFKEYKESEAGGLTWPSDNFFHYMKNLGKKYFECIEKYFQGENITKNICSILHTVSSSLFNGHIHEEKAISFIIQKYVKMMLNHKIKIFNLKNAPSGKSRKRKRAHNF